MQDGPKIKLSITCNECHHLRTVPNPPEMKGCDKHFCTAVNPNTEIPWVQKLETPSWCPRLKRKPERIQEAVAIIVEELRR